jgi:hypothetical protein
LRLTRSQIEAYFGSRAFAEHIKSREAEMRLHVESITRVDGVVKAIGGLGKLIAAVMRPPRR